LNRTEQSIPLFLHNAFVAHFH